jgi:cation transport ATPase
VGIAISNGAPIAREIADVTISENDLGSIVTLRKLSKAMIKRINRNYRSILAVNGGLIALGSLGILPPATSALLHNGSTIGVSLQSMTNIL